MVGELVTCVRCASEVAANQADYSADGMLCRRCAFDAEQATRLGVAHVGDDAIAIAARGLMQSKARKQLAIGALGVVVGLPLLAVQVWAGMVSIRALTFGLGFVVGGIAELVRGVTGLARLPALPPAPDPIAKAYVVRR